MRNKIILLVEDSPDDVELTRMALRSEQTVGHLAVVGDGQEALDWLFCRGVHAERNPAEVPSLILLDLQLPRLNGFEVLERIRADSRTKLLPVVVLTSSDEEQDILRSYERGANSYIRKPVDFDQFTEAVRELGLYWLVLNQGPPIASRMW
ncbi:MAG: response regulator [Thermoleophilia bacterium]